MALFKTDRLPAPVPQPTTPLAGTGTGAAGGPGSGDRESVIAPNVVIKGDVNFEGSMRLEGKIEGKVVTQGRLTVSKGAAIYGEVTAAEAVVEGTIQGNLKATDRVELSSTAQVVGDIKCVRLAIKEGAKLLGNHDIDSESIQKHGQATAGPRAQATVKTDPAGGSSKAGPPVAAS